MADTNVSKSKATGKRRKLSPEATKLLPYPDFLPLSPHRVTARWYKVIAGKRHYFGKLDDWRAALNKYEVQRDDLNVGRKPREPTTATPSGSLSTST